MTYTIKIIRKAISLVDPDTTFLFFPGEVKRGNTNATSRSIEFRLPKSTPQDSFDSFNISLGVDKDLVIEFRMLKDNINRVTGASLPGRTFGQDLDYLEHIILWTGAGTVKYEIEVIDKFRTTKNQYTLESYDLDVDSDIYPRGLIKFKWDRLIL